MDLAILEQKNLVNAWRQAQSHQSKRRKKSLLANRKPKQEKSDFDLSELLKVLITGTAKTILIATCIYAIFTGYKFTTNSPHFNINEIN